MMNIPLVLAACILSLGIGYNVRETDFRLIKDFVAQDNRQKGCMKGVTYLLDKYRVETEARIDTIFYCNKLD
jgi:hypothetical protein